MLIALALVLAAPAAAQACTKLPAGFSSEAPVARKGDQHLRTALCVRTAGRRIVLRSARADTPSFKAARGTVIGAAAAAGRRVAWIETRVTRAGRVVVVRVVRVGARGRVRPVRRLVVSRDRSDRIGETDVVLTRRGDLAWIAPRFDRDTRVGYAPPRGRPRTVAAGAGAPLALEDRVTLAWHGDGGMGYHDMHRPPGRGCPRRSAFRRIAGNEDVIVTEAGYEGGGALQVLRACFRATGRDRVIAQADDGLGNGDAVRVAGLDRHWVVLVRSSFTRYDSCTDYGQRPVDARSGRRGRVTLAESCDGEPDLAGAAGQQLAVTDHGIAAWTAGQDGARRLLAAAPGGGVTELDRGAIDGLRTQGTAVAWSRDGQPRSAPLP